MPTADLSNIFGNIITRRDVERAMIKFLRAWTPTYIAEIERLSSLPARTIPLPPDQIKSYRGGLDFNTWEQSWSPCYIVNVVPLGSPERQFGSGVYLQPFEVRVAVNFVATNQIKDLTPSGSGLLEDNARYYADMLGMAACAAILQHGQIGVWPSGLPISTKTYLSRYPSTTYPYTGNRRVARSEFRVVLLVNGVIQEAGGPEAPYTDIYQDAEDYPTVSSINVSLTAVSPAGDISS